MAAVALVREAPDASTWVRIHARQALVFGLLAGMGYLLLLALPFLIVVSFNGITTGTTVSLYAAGLLADALVGLLLIVLSLWYSARAGRGELFSIPLVTPLTDALFRMRR